MAEYSKWRFLFRKAVNGGMNAIGYVAVSELKAFATPDGSGPNLFVGGTASASETNGPYTPALAFDGNEQTTWESTATTLASKWLQYDLPAPVSLKSINLKHVTWSGEVPEAFAIQGSNDGTNWSTLAEITGFVAKTSAVGGFLAFSLVLRGVSKLDTGQPAVRVLINRWSDGAFIAQSLPDNQGNWEYRPGTNDPVLVTHIGPAGYRPISDGPIQPYDEL